MSRVRMLAVAPPVYLCLLHPRVGAAGHAMMLVAVSLQLSSRWKARWSKGSTPNRGSQTINHLIRRALVMPPWAGFGRRGNAELGITPAHLDKEAAQAHDRARDQGGTR